MFSIINNFYAYYAWTINTLLIFFLVTEAVISWKYSNVKNVMNVCINVFLCIFLEREDPHSPFCPTRDLARFPYEGDCSKYWECYEGTQLQMDCPAGLEFSAAQSRCNVPSVANCNPSKEKETMPHIL